jgi:hypothetical protein
LQPARRESCFKNVAAAGFSAIRATRSPALRCRSSSTEEVQMSRLSVLTCVALIGVTGAAGVAQAQAPVPLDPYGHPYVGANDWHPGPGDYAREAPGPQPRSYDQQAEMPMHHPMTHETAFKDEYGFRYDSRGNRIDAQGHVESPHNPNPN